VYGQYPQYKVSDTFIQKNIKEILFIYLYINCLKYKLNLLLFPTKLSLFSNGYETSRFSASWEWFNQMDKYHLLDEAS